MKNTMKILFAVMTLSVVCFGQTALTTTTLSAAVPVTCNPLPNGCIVTVASASGITASGAANQINTALYIDRELFWVTTVSGTTIGVQRAKGVGASARNTGHASGATVYIGAPQAFYNYQDTAENFGSCTATNELYLPRIYIYSGDIFDCKNGSSGGQWIRVQAGSEAASTGRTINAFCSGTVGSAETDFLNFAACSGATTNTFFYTVQTPGTLANLQVSLSANSLGTGGTILKVLKNTVATTIVCSPVAATKVCSDTTHSVSVVPGDRISFSYLGSTSDTAANVSASLGIY